MNALIESGTDMAPHNLDAETAVLAGLMLHNAELANVQDWLAEQDFYSHQHRVIYSAIVALAGSNKPADGVTVGEWIYANVTDDADGLAMLAINLACEAYTAANVVSYAEVIVEHSHKRQFIDTCQKALQAAYSRRGHSAEELAAHMAARLSAIAPVRTTGLRPYREVMKRFSDELLARHRDGKPIGMPTPWADVNKAIGGLQDGQVIVLAARSNMGKSLLGFQLARFTGLRGDAVAVFSMEMNDTDVAARDVAALGEVPLQWIIGQDLSESQEDSDGYWARATVAISEMMGASILLDDDPQLSSPQIVARAKRAHARKPLRLVVLDHLHEMTLPGKQDEALERGQALRDLKGLAKFLKCPVVVLAQLNRAGAEAKRPEVKHIRGSGGIEEVADVILFVHRPDVYNPNDRPGLVEVIVGKGRNIQTGTVVALRNQYQYQRAVDWDGPTYEFNEAPAEPKRPTRQLAPRLGSRRVRQGEDE
ncbi:DnaB-like helicase C-terminal domain-containing protein [Stenotrophomonas rhizophila]|uniref:replicative DNA helicase n=1 Tax=Stenotrophomonas rhizophila TaxID=216778 RepID=UPI00112F2EAA|nr:DnaB-like helicase C-terminal domain-containing protein [Stenotrophomonas rhizophila]